MKVQYCVIDQNVFRKTERLKNEVKNRPILLPDSAIMEMMKSSEWQSTFQRSFEYIVKNNNDVFIAYTPGKILKKEFETGIPCVDFENDIIDQESTKFLKVLKDYTKNENLEKLATLDLSVCNAQKNATNIFYDHNKNSQIFKKCVKSIETFLSDDEKKGLRNNDNYNTIFDRIKQENYGKQFLIGLGCSPKNGESLMKAKSFSFLFYMSYITLGLHWIKMGVGGLNSIGGKLISNDIIDMDFIVLGLLCGELLSEEKKVNSIFNVLSKYINS